MATAVSLSPTAALRKAIARPDLAAFRDLVALVNLRHWGEDRSAVLAAQTLAVAEVLTAVSTPAGLVSFPTIAAPERMKKAVISVGSGGFTLAWPATVDGLITAARTLAGIAEADLPPKLLAVTKNVLLTTQSCRFDKVWAKSLGRDFVSDATGGARATVVKYFGEVMAPEIYAHESAHNLATHLWGKPEPDPASEYGRAQKAEPPVSEYGALSTAEDFAEAVALYTRPYGRTALAQCCPRKFAAITRLLAPPPAIAKAWEESKHPRDHGKFAEKPGAGAASPEPAVLAVHFHGPASPGEGWTATGTDPHGNTVWAPPPRRSGLVGRLLGRTPATRAPDHGHTTTATLQARMQTSHAYQAAKQRVAARNQAGFEKLAAQTGKPVEEVKKAAAETAQELINALDVYVRVSAATLPKILAAGRFKTTHETGTSMALPNAGLRKEVEASGMGVGSDEPNPTRPVSVYMGGKGFSTVGQEKGVGTYGEIVVKLKDRVRDRSTVTFGDSLSEIQNGKAVASPMQAVTAASINPSELLHNPKFLDSHAGYHASKGFIEGQVHGGLSTSDIAEVGFPHEPDGETKAALARHGIRWRVYGGMQKALPLGVEDFGTDEWGREWLSPRAYVLLKAVHRAGLTLGLVTDKHGHRVHRWIREATVNSAKTGKPPAAPATHEQQNYHAAAKIILADPSQVSASDLKSVGRILLALPREHLRVLALSLEKKVGGTKAALADRILEHLKGKVKPDAPAPTGTAGGKPSLHVDHYDAPTAHFKSANPHATAAALADPKAGTGPNHRLPDATRPGVPDLATAKYLNNYSWGYDKPMNKALRDTGQPPPGPYGGNVLGKPHVDGPKMFAELQKVFAAAPAFGPPPITVNRGITVPAAVKNTIATEAEAAMKSGKPIVMGGFVSTSTGSGFPGNVEYTIEAIHGLDVKPYSHYPEETELLLNHGCEYKVISVAQDGHTLKIHLQQLTTGLLAKGV